MARKIFTHMKLFYYSILDKKITKIAVEKETVINMERNKFKELERAHKKILSDCMDVSLDRDYGHLEMMKQCNHLNRLVAEFNAMGPRRIFIENKISELKMLIA